MHEVTVCIPSIPTRADLLSRAVCSVSCQDRPADAISIAFDTKREGAGPTRTRALMAANTTWVAFLDDDDELLPHHLDLLLTTAREEEADVIWGWYHVQGGLDPLRLHEGRQWNRDHPHLFPITALVRTELAKEVGGFDAPNHPSGAISGEDYPFWCRLNDLGAKFLHVNNRTWIWHHHGKNTSGMPHRW